MLGPPDLTSLGAQGAQAPNFVPTYVEAAHNMPENTKEDVVWFKKPAVWISGVAAAVAVGLVLVINPFQPQANNHLPGVSGSPSGASSSSSASSASGTASSTSVSPSGSSGASTSTQASSTNSTSSLPNGLKPAHPDVYWEDSAECKAFDVEKVMVYSFSAKEFEPLKGKPEDNPVAGCYGGYATYVSLPDRVLYEKELSDVFTGLYVAKWDGKRWLVNHMDETDGVESLIGLSTYPLTRAFPDPEGRTAAEVIQKTLDDLEVSVDDPEKLLGPNRSAWAPTEPAASTADFNESGVSGNQRSDWKLVTRDRKQDDTTIDELRFFDQYGATAASLTVWSPSPEAECYDPGTTYEILAREDIDLKAKAGALSVALVTSTDESGRELSAVSLVDRNAAKSGKACDLPARIELTNGKSLESSITPVLGFETANEQQEFLNSQYWADLVDFAGGLKVK